MALTYKLVGYDRQTELVAAEHILPAAFVKRAKAIAGIAARPEIIGDWPLSADQARCIAEIVEISIDFDRYDWLLEPYPSAEADQTINLSK
jgi:hypothetical protein